MALFRRKGDEAQPPRETAPSGQGEVRELMAQNAWCRLCNADQAFSRTWLRVKPPTACPCCGTPFDDLDALYRKNLPACPHCGEHLEHPGFQYGLCDGCGSKYELMQGAKPSLLPSKEQRKAMDQYGKAWSYD